MSPVKVALPVKVGVVNIVAFDSFVTFPNPKLALACESVVAPVPPLPIGIVPPVRC